MRIAIVNDSRMATEVMSRVLAGVHEIAWTARTGREAVEQCAKDRPDLILMDLIMPELDGVEATREIMANTPCPILIVTASVGVRADKVFEALGAGALDAVKTPNVGLDGADGGAALLLAKVDTMRRLIGLGNGRPLEQPKPPRTAMHLERLVIFGASAGGPAALAEILGHLPADFPAAIVIVQHVDEEFAPLMAQWLNDQSRIPVRIAREGDRPQIGLVLLASTGDHLVMTRNCVLGYTGVPEAGSYRPSVDVFFESVALCWQGEVVGVLLTGMGRDGAKGLKALRDRGAMTLTQDRDSCVVYGMPKAAAELNAAVEILPLRDIAERLSTRRAMQVPITHGQKTTVTE